MVIPQSVRRRRLSFRARLPESYSIRRRQVPCRLSLAPGDVLVIDNILAMHGRKPYRGERRVLMAIG